MSEVTLEKRLVAAATIVLAVIGMTACTREKPPAIVPTPLGGVALLPTATPVPISESASPTPFPTLPEPTPTEALSIPAVPPTPTAGTPPGRVGTSVAALGSLSTYTVQWGDWLNKIAQRYGLTYQALLAANPGLNPNRIYPGQVISIPSGAGTSPETGPTGGATTYTVQRGDWLYAIARKFGVSVAALQAANPSVTSNVVYPGQVLNIPARGTGAPPPNPKNLVRYTVQYGDTLFSIAVRFHTTTYALQIANHLANSNFIYPGQVLTIP